MGYFSVTGTDAKTAAESAQAAAEAAEATAVAAKTEVLAALDTIDDRNLGAKASDPTTDNDGDALLLGAQYFNTTDNTMRVYNGTAWQLTAPVGALINSNNLSDVSSAATARTNLGLGTAATTDASAYALASQADQTVALTAGTGLSVSGTYPNFTLVNSAPDQTVALTAGTGLSVTGTYPNFTVTNTAPEQTVVLTGAGATTISGTHPNFTITSANTTYSVGDGGLTQNNFTNALLSKLNGIETSADVTDTANVVAALTAGANITIAADGTIASTATSSSNTTYGISWVDSNNDAILRLTPSAGSNDDLTFIAGTNITLTPSGDNLTFATTATVNDTDANLKNRANHTGVQAISTITGLQTALDGKVDTVTGKALSANDFTDTLLTKLNAIEASADVTDTANVVSALTAGNNVTIAADGTISATDTNTTYSVGDGGLTQNNFTNALKTKLDAIEPSADVTDTANVTAAGALMDSEVDADIKTLALPANTTISAFGKTLVDDTDAATARTTLGLGTAAITAATDYATAAQGTTADNALPKSGGAMTGAITTNSTFDGRDVATDGAKLDGIEDGATADQTDAEIRAAVEAASDSNVFTDADHTKLNGIETGATADQTGSEIKSAYESESDTNAFTDAEKTKLTGIESSATADQTDAEIETAYNNQVAQVSSAERTQGTEAGIRRYSPSDIKSMVAQHSGSASVTTAAVDNAGAVMNTDTTTASMGFVIDEDNFASDSATKVPTQQSVKAYIASYADRVGTYVWADTQPSGTLPCNGSAYNRSDYAALYAKNGPSGSNTLGFGNGSTTFNTIDPRGRVPRVTDDGKGVDPDASSRSAMFTGTASGDAPGSIQDDRNASHHHFAFHDSAATSSSTALTTSTAAHESNPLTYSEGIYRYETLGTTSAADVGKTSSQGGTDARMKNFGLRLWVYYE